MAEQASPTALAEDPSGDQKVRVVYLLGAGATQGSISYVGGQRHLLMSALTDPIAEELHKTAHSAGVDRLLNAVVASDSKFDFEQVITFLEDSPSLTYREFSSELREAFSLVLLQELEKVENELGSECYRLFAALVDMHSVNGFHESLRGFLTLNYDVFLERAVVESLNRDVDYGVATAALGNPVDPVKVLKLHGSFGWSGEWPISVELKHSPGYWIPPGIRKPKTEYPFNAIWGLARELLACDVVRIIGCNLGPNDWDLVSLLFSTSHTHATDEPYRIEVISSGRTADRIRDQFPYLEVLSLPELPIVGKQIVGELLGSKPQAFSGLSTDKQKQVFERLGDKNTFEYWLTQMAEAMTIELGELSSPRGVFKEFAGR